MHHRWSGMRKRKGGGATLGREIDLDLEIMECADATRCNVYAGCPDVIIGTLLFRPCLANLSAWGLLGSYAAFQMLYI